MPRRRPRLVRRPPDPVSRPGNGQAHAATIALTAIALVGMISLAVLDWRQAIDPHGVRLCTESAVAALAGVLGYRLLTRP